MMHDAVSIIGIVSYIIVHSNQSSVYIDDDATEQLQKGAAHTQQLSCSSRASHTSIVKCQSGRSVSKRMSTRYFVHWNGIE